MEQTEILVGIDGSSSAERALLWAAGEAHRRGVRLVLLHAGDPEPRPAQAGGQHPASGQGLVRDSIAMVTERGFDCEVAAVLRDGPAVPLLIELGAQAALVVVGSHGLGRTSGTLLGSVAYRVAAHSTSPVAVVVERQPDVRASESLPVGVGLTPGSGGRPALEFAFATAALRGVGLDAVHSWAEVGWAEHAALRGTAAGLSARQQQFLNELLAPLRARYPSVPVTVTLSGDAVSLALSNASQRSGLLVLGCRQQSGQSVPRLGPTSARLIHISSCPVVVVGRDSPPSPIGASSRHLMRAL